MEFILVFLKVLSIITVLWLVIEMHKISYKAGRLDGYREAMYKASCIREKVYGRINEDKEEE